MSGGPANADLLAEIKKRGEFIVGTEARFPPFEFVEDGKIVGYSTDIMAHVMKALPGVKLKRLDLPWQGILPGLAAAKFDYVVTSVTVTKERYAKYALSLPIADATMALVKRKGDDSIKAPADIAGPRGRLAGRLGPAAGPPGLRQGARGRGRGRQGDQDICRFQRGLRRSGGGADQRGMQQPAEPPRAGSQAAGRVRDGAADIRPQEVFQLGPGRKDAESASLAAFMDEQLAALNKSGVLTELQKKWFGGPMDLPSDSLPVPAD